MLNCVIFKNGSLEVKSGYDNSNSYEMISGNVGGYIERLPCIREFEKRNIDIWVDEEGLLKSLPVTAIVVKNEEVVGVIKGNIVFAKGSPKTGRTLKLTDKDLDFIQGYVENHLYMLDNVVLALEV